MRRKYFLMKQAFIDSNVFRPQRNVEELTLALSRLLLYQKKWGAYAFLETVLSGPTLITLSIVAEGLEDNTKIKHTAQFVSNMNQRVL